MADAQDDAISELQWDQRALEAASAATAGEFDGRFPGTMASERLYIPDHYVETRTLRARLWKRPSPPDTEPWETLLDDIVANVERCLDFELTCHLHVVVHATNQDYRSSVGRDVPDTMLMAPLLGARASVIAVHSASANPINGDCVRMRRQLCHELGHVMVALRTGSEKRLGDGDRGLRVRPWVNEGFAECVAAIACNRLDLIERALQTQRSCGTPPPDLDAAINDLNGADRSRACAFATAQVWQAIQGHGLRQVFATLMDPVSWDAPKRAP